MRYALIDGKPVPAQMAPAMRAVKARTGATLVSCLRDQAAVGWARRRGARLQSQPELWNGWVRRLPGVNPANPPGFSTHELRNDGPAYPNLPRGARLPWWAAGQDWEPAKVPAVIAAYRALGWLVTRTYPSSLREAQHVNVRRPGRTDPLAALDRRGRAVAERLLYHRREMRDAARRGQTRRYRTNLKWARFYRKRIVAAWRRSTGARRAVFARVLAAKTGRL